MLDTATPLLDADDNTGVWMVVIVDENSAASSKNQVPSALSKREDEPLDISTQKESEEPAENQGLDEKHIHQNEDGCEAEQASHVPSEHLESPKTQRSESVTEKEYTIANDTPLESTNGSRMYSPGQSSPRTLAAEHAANGDGGQEIPTTPPGTELESISDVTAKQHNHSQRETQSARDVGIRAIDYLSNRSSLQQLKAREMADNRGQERGDLSAASPYSVD